MILFSFGNMHLDYYIIRVKDEQNPGILQIKNLISKIIKQARTPSFSKCSNIERIL